jgi:hypothetical protein
MLHAARSRGQLAHDPVLLNPPLERTRGQPARYSKGPWARAAQRHVGRHDVMSDGNFT